MLYSKISRIIWIIILLVSIIGRLISQKDIFFIYLFTIGSALIFIIDFLNVSRYYKSGNRAKVKKKWHILANLTQWIFWSALVYVPFVSTMSIGYKIFVLVDLFIVATYIMYKYKA